MPAVVSIAQRKGGAGKTTLTAHLAVSWAMAGQRVALVDIDPQASLSGWFELRRERLGAGNEGLGFASVSGWRMAVEVGRLAREHDIVLIDSPPHAETEARLAVRVANLVLVPMQPSPLDLWATRWTLELASRAAVRTLVVLNRISARASLTAETIASLAEYPVGVARQALGNRVAFPASMAIGLTALETRPVGEAAEEVRMLASELLATLYGDVVETASTT